MHNGSYLQYGQAAPPMSNYGAPLQQSHQHQPHPSASYPSVPAYFQQQQQPPNPALQIATDPNAFAQMFKSHLAALTFNSKPIITDLTLISHEHVARMSQVVAQCLEEHILTCPPAIRLPALYAMDSICKNVGQPYTTLWSDRMLRIFMETYRLVDHNVKMRMEELLATWRNSGMNGAPLFGEAAQWNIERSIFGSAGPPPAVSTIRSPLIQPNHGGNSPSHGQQSQRMRTIERLNRLLAIGAHDQHHNAHLYDGDRMQALAKLRTLVTDTPLSGEEMKQIDSQLDALEGELEARRQAQPSVLPSITAAPAIKHSPQPSSGTVSLPPSVMGALANLAKLGVGSGTSTPPVNHAATAATSSGRALNSTPVASIQNILANFQQSGHLSSQTALPSAVVQQDLEYSNMIMSLNLKLTTTDMQRELPLGSLEAIHFKELPLQCRQCANRYPSGSKGQASMDQHLDWHFRQNRRAKDSSARGQSRSWFSRLEDWIRGGHDDEAPSKRNEDVGANSGRAQTSLTPAQEAELKLATNAFVIAPSDDPGVATKPCPICKELFKSEWSEDEEEWIWKNAVKVNGVYFHGSCQYSAKTLSTSVRSTGSREATPLADDQVVKPTSGSRLTQIKEEGSEQKTLSLPPTIVGTKRKADSNVKEEEGEESASKILKQENA